MNVALVLEMVAEGAPDRLVLGRTGSEISAAQLLERSRGAAAWMQESGATRIGYFGLNSDSLPIAVFGSALAGLPFVPINYRSPDEQLRQLLQRIPETLMIATSEEAARLQAAGAEQILNTDDFWSMSKSNSGIPLLPFVDPDDVAVMLFTSGTTSEPKAALLRHRHLVSYILAGIEFLGSAETETQLVCVPSYHIAGVSSVLSSLFAGRRIIYLPAFEPEGWVRTVVDERVTHAMVVPTMLSRILKYIEMTEIELPSLQHLSYGGGAMPLEVVERVLHLMPTVDLVNAYGLTETSSTISILSPEDHREAFASTDPNIRKRLRSVGRPLPTLEVEIRDSDGSSATMGSKGEIWVRGEQVSGEYVGRSALDEKGWFPTRDLGWFDDAGFLYLAGRIDDVIVRGAENISPGEIEEVLMQHPAVTDAAVVGIPDPEWGEAVAAVVVLNEGWSVPEAELQTWVRERLRSTKMPSHVEFRDELPYSPTGKLLRRVLRDALTLTDERHRQRQ